MAYAYNDKYTINGVEIKEKIIPDNMKWTNAKAAKSEGFKVGATNNC